MKTKALIDDLQQETVSKTFRSKEKRVAIMTAAKIEKEKMSKTAIYRFLRKMGYKTLAQDVIEGKYDE